MVDYSQFPGLKKFATVDKSTQNQKEGAQKDSKKKQEESPRPDSTNNAPK